MPEALNLHAGVAIVLFLLALVVLFAGMANRLRVPYPIVLVVAGLLISFIPHVPRVPLAPDLVFVVFLPPLLYASAWQTDFRSFKAELVPISLLAFGLVGFTVLGVALFADRFITALDFKSGFVLGAVVAATDALAASSIARTIGLPRRVMTLLEGESLLNDATSLLALEFALALLLRGDPPSFAAGTLRLVWLLLGGSLVGLALGFLAHRVERHIDDGPIEMVISLILPYTAYLVAEELKSSGVIAVVACGLYLSRFRSEIFSAQARLQILSAWKALDFLLNGLVFVLIGLQLPYVLAGIHGFGRWTLALYGLVFSLILILLRMLWVFPFAALAALVRRLRGKPADSLNPRETFVIGWTGMRGVVALAAAISLPETLGAGQPFAQRNLIVFLTFSIILVTLVLQGLTLPALVRALGLAGSGSDGRDLAEARQAILQAALRFLRKRRGTLKPGAETHLHDDLIHRYTHMLEEAEAPAATENADAGPSPRMQLARNVLEVERRTLYRLEDAGKVDEEVARQLERELDLLETRFAEGQG